MYFFLVCFLIEPPLADNCLVGCIFLGAPGATVPILFSFDGVVGKGFFANMDVIGQFWGKRDDLFIVFGEVFSRFI